MCPEYFDDDSVITPNYILCVTAIAPNCNTVGVDALKKLHPPETIAGCGQLNRIQ
jgi:hypothetical protein